MSGKTGAAHFKSKENVVHQDIVYAKDSPISVKSCTLFFPDGTNKLMIRDGKILV